MEHTYNTSNAASEVLVVLLLGGTNLNYVEHKGFVGILSAGAQKHQEYSEIEVFTIRKELEDWRD